MSRSHKKTPVTKGNSENHQWKKSAARVHRHKLKALDRELMLNPDSPTDSIDRREVSDYWWTGPGDICFADHRGEWSEDNAHYARKLFKK